MSALTWTAIGILLTFSIFLANIIYRAGTLSARVDELERWRTDVRRDLHEVSDKLEAVRNEVHRLATLIEERTERRFHFSEQFNPEKRNT